MALSFFLILFHVRSYLDVTVCSYGMETDVRKYLLSHLHALYKSVFLSHNGGLALGSL